MRSSSSGSLSSFLIFLFSAMLAAIIVSAPVAASAQSRDKSKDNSGQKETARPKEPERRQEEKSGSAQDRQQDRGDRTRRDDGRTGGDKNAGDRRSGGETQTGRGKDTGGDQNPPRRKDPDPTLPPRRGGDDPDDRRGDLPDPRKPRDPNIGGKKIPGIIPGRSPKEPDRPDPWIRPDVDPIITPQPGIRPLPPRRIHPILPPPPRYYPPYVIHYGEDLNWIEVPDFMWDDPYAITLPFGAIMPWEIGEFFLISLKGLEDDGYGESMVVIIVQTQDEMYWEEFLEMYADLIADVRYYGDVGPCSFLVAMPVTTVLDLLVDNGIRWAGEYRSIYKIEPGGRNQQFYIRSLEGDQMEFRRDLSDIGLDVIEYRRGTGEYTVFSTLDLYEDVAGLWWVASVSSRPDNPFLRPVPEEEEIDVGAAPVVQPQAE